MSSSPQWRNGHCGATAMNEGVHCAENDVQGSWFASSSEGCVRRCSQCRRCYFVSYSEQFQDCSWYRSCAAFSSRLTEGGTGHATLQIRDTSSAVVVKEHMFRRSRQPQTCTPRVQSRGLKLLASLCFRPTAILDLGANRGTWTRSMVSVFPTARFLMIDGTNYSYDWASLLASDEPLHVDAAVAVLDREERIAPWWFGDTGSSLRKEQTGAASSFRATPRVTDTLDGLVGRLEGSGAVPGGNYSLVKLDVQGNELDVLSGGLKLVAQTEVLLIEMPFAGTYNQNTPSFAEHIAFLDRLGFSCFDITEQHTVDGRGGLLQGREGFLFQVDLVRAPDRLQRNFERTLRLYQPLST